MSISIFKAALIEGVEKQFNKPTKEYSISDLNIKASFVLRAKSTGIPVGAFYLYNEVPTEWLPEWDRVNKKLVRCPIYVINLRRFIKTGEVECVEVCKGSPTPSFKPLEVAQATTTTTEAIKPSESLVEPYSLTLTHWSKNNFTRYYVNGEGNTPAEKTANFKNIFESTPPEGVRVYVQNGYIKCFPKTPIKKAAYRQILEMYKQQGEK